MAHTNGVSLANDTQSVMLREISEPALSRSRLPSFVAVIGLIALALPLAACGRKGSLDPPPGGYVLESGTARTPTSGRGAAPLPDKQPEYDDEGRPIAPQGRKRKLPGDWLID
jgi:predicted small lipoprotein YifL